MRRPLVVLMLALTACEADAVEGRADRLVGPKKKAATTARAATTSGAVQPAAEATMDRPPVAGSVPCDPDEGARLQQALGLEGPIVLHNGALVKDSASGRTLSSVTLAADLCRETLAALRPHGPPIVYVDRWPGTDFVTERGPSHPTQAEYLAEHGASCEFVADLASEALEGVLMVSVMADASAASTALPPLSSMRRPAWAARGCDVATMFDASTGMRCDV